MKKTGLLLSMIVTMALVATVNVKAQSLRDVFEKYDRGGNVISLNIGRFGCSLLGTLIPCDEPQAKELFKSTSRINIFVSEGRGDVPELRRDIKKYARKNRLEEMITVKSGDDNVRIYAMDNDRDITQVLIVVSDGSDFVVLNMRGKYRKESVRRWIEDEDFIVSINHVAK